MTAADFVRHDAYGIIEIAAGFRDAGVILTFVQHTASGCPFWREFQPIGWSRLYVERGDGIALLFTLLAIEPTETNFWQRDDAIAIATISYALVGGTSAYAARHGVSCRRAQQVFKKVTTGIAEGHDLFSGYGLEGA